jgi:membrane-anchored protein YejM (alkaline phosphatase superfamily)
VEVIDGYAKSGKPFFVSLHFNAPHWPWEAPGDEAESVRIRGKGLIGQMDFDGGTQETYRRMITAMDLQIGRVIETLSANGILGRMGPALLPSCLVVRDNQLCSGADVERYI